MNGSFLKDPFATGPSHTGLDIQCVRSLFIKILGTANGELLQALTTGITASSAKLKESPPIQPEGLRAFLIIMQYPLLQKATKGNSSIMAGITTSIASLNDKMKSILIKI